MRCRKSNWEACKVGDETEVKKVTTHMESREKYVFQNNKIVKNFLYTIFHD